MTELLLSDANTNLIQEIPVIKRTESQIWEDIIRSNSKNDAKIANEINRIITGSASGDHEEHVQQPVQCDEATRDQISQTTFCRVISSQTAAHKDWYEQVTNPKQFNELSVAEKSAKLKKTSKRSTTGTMYSSPQAKSKAKRSTPTEVVKRLYTIPTIKRPVTTAPIKSISCYDGRPSKFDVPSRYLDRVSKKKPTMQNYGMQSNYIGNISTFSNPLSRRAGYPIPLFNIFI